MLVAVDIGLSVCIGDFRGSKSGSFDLLTMNYWFLIEKDPLQSGNFWLLEQPDVLVLEKKSERSFS